MSCVSGKHGHPAGAAAGGEDDAAPSLCPVVQREIRAGIRRFNVHDYTDEGVAAPGDGMSVVRLLHRGDAHTVRWLVDCFQWGKDVAAELRRLGVGVKGKLLIVIKGGVGREGERHRQTDRDGDRDRRRDRERERERRRQRQTERDRDKQTETGERERQRQGRERDRDRQRERETETQREMRTMVLVRM